MVRRIRWLDSDTRSYLINRQEVRARASVASEPRDRSEPAQRRARARVGESEGRRPSDETSGLSPLKKDHLAGGASRLAALLLP